MFNLAKQIEKQIQKDIFNFKPKANQNTHLHALLSNYPYSFKEFCTLYVKIYTKDKGLQPFILNEWQEEAYKFVLNLYEKHKQIDVLIIKGRQGGMTTFSVIWLLYQMLSLKCNVSIMCDKYDNTKNAFEMLNNAVNNIASVAVQQSNYGRLVRINNALARFASAGFDKRKSDKLRGQTMLGLLNDELGERNDNLETEGLANADNKTYFKVGTPKGTGNNLHLVYSYYKQHKKENILFLPWFTLTQYESQEKVPLSSEIEEYLTKYNLRNLPEKKQWWLEYKYRELKSKSYNPLTLLNQEYPPNLDVGFDATAENCFCNPYYIDLAFKGGNVKKEYQAYIGVDVAGHGDDKSIMCIRFDTHAFFYELKSNNMDFSGFKDKAEMLISILNLRQFAGVDYKQINIDVTGVGEGFPDYVKQSAKQYNRKFKLKLVPVHFSRRVTVDHSYLEESKRAIRDHMYFKLRQWLEGGNVLLPSDNYMLKEELIATQVKTTNGQEFIIPKEDIKKNLRRSPDYADALALTFVQDELPDVKIYPDNIVKDIFGVWNNTTK